MPVAAGPIGHGARRKQQQNVYINIRIDIYIAKLWLTLAKTCQRWREDPVSCALMSGLLMRASSLAIMGVR
jgi:hypothetical protein